ncbi:hypothetical protein FA13DRAFT_1641399 [Coprinellus micaceus]|uniref:P-loop containing nucleoside triphosphate hydrolase protein n=1 Tax=Coprinellus micaceus TaxID=71717 RepID=A0A4Y7SKX4_COPMI|nr:hypothetical protein FA13DRAFT_1641399 [Coprinellus micaceus]
MKKTGTIKDENRRRMHVSRLQDLSDWHERRYLPPANETWPTCLIIAPSTVCHNWQREFETWGYFEVGMYTGEREVRKDVLKEFKMGRLDVVVTSFDLALRDIEDLKDEAWSCVIIDEVHRVKNEKSNTTQALHTFPQRGRFGLTGTTIQNSYNEMWNILDWTNPGRVGTSKEWVKYVTKPLTSGQSASATDKQRAMKQLVANTLTNELLPQLFLRRTKEVIRNRLPKKFDNVVFCPLTNFQIGAYKRVLEMDGVQNLVKRDEPCDCGSNNKRKECCHPFDAKDMFKFMTILIKISNHLALIMPGSDDTPEQAQRNQEVCDVIFPHENPSQDLAFLQPQLCGKWKTLAALLKDWRKDPTNKVLIFTKSIKLLNMLDHHIKTRSYGYLRLDGSTKQSDRMATIDKFQKDPDIFIFLISTLAGGTGLNLTAANKVVVFDPNWNPAHDLQAMDRAFRFGQERDVTVVRLLGAGSVEELIYARQIYKQQQMAIGYEASVQTRYFDGVQGDTTKRGELFGLENIFSLQEDKMPTKFIIEEAKVAEIDWAHANSGGPRKKRQSGTNADVLEAESQIGGEDAELKGLASFLFDDAPKPNTAQDNLQKVLAGGGAMYSHVNDEVLAESRMEKEKLSKPTKGTRQRKGATTGKKSPAKEPPGPWWPPRRKHHQREETVEFKIQARRDAFERKG